MISIIVPAYNEEKYIEACLASILRQKTQLEFELIVVNNNSSDQTKQIIQRFNIPVIDEPNKGVSIARNTGARYAKGDVLWFVDADCELLDNSIQELEHLMNEYKDVSAFGGPYRYFDGGLLMRVLTVNLNYFYFYSKFIQFLSGVPSIAGGNIIITKEAFEAVGGFDESMGLSSLPEDLGICRKLGKHGFKLQVTNRLAIISSFRRFKNRVNPDALRRFYATMKLLFTDPS